MIKIGDTAPDFELPNQSGEMVSLGGLLGNGELVLYFYPADFTPICTAEACAFRDVYDDLTEIDVQVVGISPQSVDSHQRFASRHSLPFPILCDERKSVIKAYRVDGPLGFGVRRATYLIDKDQTVANRVVSDLFVGSHMDLVKAVINRD
ncbi:MAG: peroxiredoxin [Gammaproteobacteria bacterium]|nr:peroxiredoxin [Gammaproteobacteria bacterium]